MTWNTTPIVLPVAPSDIKSGCSLIRREVDQIWFHSMDLARTEGAEFDKAANAEEISKHVLTLLQNVHMLETYAEQIAGKLREAERARCGLQP